MSVTSQTRVADTTARDAYATPLSAADDGLYHPAQYVHGADNLYQDSQTNRGPTTLQGVRSVANEIVTNMLPSPVWHTTTRLSEIRNQVSPEKQAMATDIFRSSSIASPSGTKSATTFHFPVTSTTSVANNLPQRKEPAPKESRVYHLLIIFLVASLIILMIVAWFKRHADRKKPILATNQQPTVDPTLPKERFAAALSQSKALVTGFLAMSAEAISVVLASFSSAKSKAKIDLKDGTTTFTTRRSLMGRFLEQRIRIIIRAVVKISNFRRWIPNLPGRERANDQAFVEKDEDMTVRSSSLEEGSRGPPRDSADEQSHLDTSYRVTTKIRPPPPVIIIGRTRHRSESGLKVEVPRGPVSPDTVCLEDVCAANESSDTLRGSETISLQTIDECHGLGQSPSVGLLRLNVYRVEMEFVPRRDTQLGVSQGDEVVMTRVFDDGWVSWPWSSYLSKDQADRPLQAFCELLRTKKQGLVPRACLSVWPARRNNTPPSVTSVQLVPPTANSHTNSRPTSPISPISPISPNSAVFPRFYSSGSSTESLS
ncbi:uncharacterized protein N7496_009119 [Penicillium cataractarum]|uniref:SH3 domain-containing protein n=1 Tax=Penicillium cataractarum TaxID=2100454 RepID=A0A9W9S1L1_9EURO|nr:uncharacterized protein N7496_009119 [Penicillium cataractarum]KAJ5369359.1 hypothetical protein N7496_009119 [Penicillium cataractarum]